LELLDRFARGAADAAAREDWEELGISIAVMVVATASAFAGPRGVWPRVDSGIDRVISFRL
jgi:8-oxo-dGTP pyrophosphatase MutT (NUDIX family)